MSRAYRISVSESVRRHVRVSDGIRTQLEVLDVLPPAAMRGLLTSELAQRGFEADGDDMVRVDDDGVEIRVGVSGENAGHVTVRLTKETDVDIEVERGRRVWREIEEQTRSELQAQVEEAVERQASGAEAELSAEVTEVLERKLRDLRRELDGVANRVTAEALKVRARQMGEIKEISEDPETGSLTIKVRV